MSKTFEIFPTADVEINWEYAIQDTIELFNNRFQKNTLTFSSVKIEKNNCKNNTINPLNLNITKSECEIDFIHTDPFGVLEVSFHLNTDNDYEFWKEEYKYNNCANSLIDKINKTLEMGYSWRITRNAAQSSLCSVLHGYLVIVLCKLSQGLIYSDDGAWEYRLMPIQYADFLDVYLKVDKIIDLSLKRETEFWINDICNNI